MKQALKIKLVQHIESQHYKNKKIKRQKIILITIYFVKADRQQILSFVWLERECTNGRVLLAKHHKQGPGKTPAVFTNKFLRKFSRIFSFSFFFVCLNHNTILVSLDKLITMSGGCTQEACPHKKALLPRIDTPWIISE